MLRSTRTKVLEAGDVSPDVIFGCLFIFAPTSLIREMDLAT